MAPLDPGSLPEPCRALAHVPQDAQITRPAMDARISVASCLAEQQLHNRSIEPTEASAQQLLEAMNPSIALYDDVITHGNAEEQLVALHAKADLYAGMSTRLLASVAPEERGGQAMTDLAEVNRVDAMTRPWRELAAASYRQVAQLGDRNPGLAQANPVVAYAVRDSKVGESTIQASR